MRCQVIHNLLVSSSSKLARNFVKPYSNPMTIITAHSIPLMHQRIHYLAALNSTGKSGLQTWIRTAERNMTCLEVFSYFYGSFSWNNGTPDHRVSRLNFNTDLTDETGWRNRVSTVVFFSLTDMALSNLTVSLNAHQRLASDRNIIITGLRGCDETARNFWINNTLPSPQGL